jgi:hypothetical protein
MRHSLRHHGFEAPLRVCLASFRDGQLPGSVSPKVANAEIKVNAAFVLLFFYRGIGYEVRDIEDGKKLFCLFHFRALLKSTRQGE